MSSYLDRDVLLHRSDAIVSILGFGLVSVATRTRAQQLLLRASYGDELGLQVVELCVNCDAKRHQSGSGRNKLSACQRLTRAETPP